MNLKDLTFNIILTLSNAGLFYVMYLATKSITTL